METHLGRERVSVATGQIEAAHRAHLSLSSGGAWKGIRLDQSTLPPADEQEGYLTHHSVVVHGGSALRLAISSPGDAPRVAELRAGEVLIFPAGVHYRARWDDPWDLVVVRLSASGPGCLAPPGLFRRVVTAGDALLRDLVLALRNEVEGGAAGSELYAEALGSALGAHLVHQYGTAPAAGAGHKGGLPARRLRELRDYVEEHLGGPLHLPDLAQLVGSSVRQLARAFKESTSLTPHQFVLLRRIERAKTLLESSNLPVRAVAAACGFASQSRFTSAFRRVTRATPSAWRGAR